MKNIKKTSSSYSCGYCVGVDLERWRAGLFLCMSSTIYFLLWHNLYNIGFAILVIFQDAIQGPVHHRHHYFQNVFITPDRNSVRVELKGPSSPPQALGNF